MFTFSVSKEELRSLSELVQIGYLVSNDRVLKFLHPKLTVPEAEKVRDLVMGMEVDHDLYKPDSFKESTMLSRYVQLNFLGKLMSCLSTLKDNTIISDEILEVVEKRVYEHANMDFDDMEYILQEYLLGIIREAQAAQLVKWDGEFFDKRAEYNSEPLINGGIKPSLVERIFFEDKLLERDELDFSDINLEEAEEEVESLNSNIPDFGEKDEDYWEFVKPGLIRNINYSEEVYKLLLLGKNEVTKYLKPGEVVKIIVEDIHEYTGFMHKKSPGRIGRIGKMFDQFPELFKVGNSILVEYNLKNNTLEIHQA